MFETTRSLTRTAAVLALALTLTACGGSPTSAARSVSKAKTSPSTAAAPIAPPTGTSGTDQTTTPAAPAATGAVLIMLSSLKADGVAGVAVQLTGPGLEEPIGKTLTAEELKTSNTLAFENIPAGKLKAEVAAFDADEESLGATTTDVTIAAEEETRVAIQLTAPAETAGQVAFKFVSPEAFDAAPVSNTPADEPAADEDEGDATPIDGTPVSGSDKALEVEIVDMQTIRKFLLFKKLEVTVRVTNENPTETLNGEVKIDFHKLKGFFSKEDVIVETLTAPVSGLAPGKSVDITLTSTKSAEDAEATVHTVVSSSSASSFE